jgi:hypothetical protein
VAGGAPSEKGAAERKALVRPDTFAEEPKLLPVISSRDTSIVIVSSSEGCCDPARVVRSFCLKQSLRSCWRALVRTIATKRSRSAMCLPCKLMLGATLAPYQTGYALVDDVSV